MFRHIRGLLPPACADDVFQDSSILLLEIRPHTAASMPS